MQDTKKQGLFWGIFVAGAIIFILILAIIDPAAEKDTSTGSEAAEEVNIMVTEDDWTQGNPDAAITLVEYADFECPACAAYHSVVKEVVDKYQDDIQYVYRHFPLVSIHKNAEPAARAAEAAGAQDAFWGMQDKLFENQGEWAREGNPKELFLKYANELDLDAEEFAADYASDSIKEKVRASLREANTLKLSGTPTFILDNRILKNAPSTVEGFSKIIENRLKFVELLSESTEESTK